MFSYAVYSGESLPDWAPAPNSIQMGVYLEAIEALPDSGIVAKPPCEYNIVVGPFARIILIQVLAPF